MELPNNLIIKRVANYWGIETLEMFESVLSKMDNPNTKIKYYGKKGLKSIRVNKLKQILQESTL